MYIFFMEKLALLNSIVWLYFTVPILVNSFLFFLLQILVQPIDLYTRVFSWSWSEYLWDGFLEWDCCTQGKNMYFFLCFQTLLQNCAVFPSPQWCVKAAGPPAHQQSSHRTLGATFQSDLWKNGISTRIFFLILSKVEYLKLKILLHFFFSITYKKSHLFLQG